jgi:hypothetical protein
VPACAGRGTAHTLFLGLGAAPALGGAALRAAGCSSRNIYREKVTGAWPDRRELNRMLGKLAPGDVVTVTRIDHLARSTFDLFGIVKRIVYAKAQFRSLAEPWADTGTSTALDARRPRRLAAVERDLIRTLSLSASRVDGSVAIDAWRPRSTSQCLLSMHHARQRHSRPSGPESSRTGGDAGRGHCCPAKM